MGLDGHPVEKAIRPFALGPGRRPTQFCADRRLRESLPAAAWLRSRRVREAGRKDFVSNQAAVFHLAEAIE